MQQSVLMKPKDVVFIILFIDIWICLMFHVQFNDTSIDTYTYIFCRTTRVERKIISDQQIIQIEHCN